MIKFKIIETEDHFVRWQLVEDFDNSEENQTIEDEIITESADYSLRQDLVDQIILLKMFAGNAYFDVENPSCGIFERKQKKAKLGSAK